MSTPEAKERGRPGTAPGLGNAASHGWQHEGECTVLHQGTAAARIEPRHKRLATLAGHLRAHGGAARRHLRALLGPWAGAQHAEPAP